MENATKALMIAGAVLIAILIIGVGMMIYNSAQGSIEGATSKISQQEIELFNSGFTQYEGNVSGSQVKSLISSVINNNNQYGTTGDNVPEKVIQVTGGGKTGATTSADISAIRAALVAGKQYNVAVSYNDFGYVNAITITDLSAGGSTGGNNT